MKKITILERRYNHIFVIKDVLDNKLSSSTMAFVGSLKMKPDMYKSVVSEISNYTSTDIELQFRVLNVGGSNSVSIKPYHLARLIVQGFLNESKGTISVQQLFDVYRLVEIINGKQLSHHADVPSIDREFVKSFCGSISSIYKLRVLELNDV